MSIFAKLRNALAPKRAPHEDYIGGKNLDSSGRPVAEAYIYLPSRRDREHRFPPHRFGVARGTGHTLEEWSPSRGWENRRHNYTIRGKPNARTSVREALRKYAPEMMEHLARGGHLVIFPDEISDGAWADWGQDSFFDVDF